MKEKHLLWLIFHRYLTRVSDAQTTDKALFYIMFDIHFYNIWLSESVNNEGKIYFQWAWKDSIIFAE